MIEKILASMTMEEKIKMLSGKDFWRTQDYPEKGVVSVEVADGPYGLRKQTGLCDHMGWNKSEPATAYVSGPGLASSWDRNLARETGMHLAAEAAKQNVDVLLGPAINIDRTPLCGRTFEYYSEDPLLAGELSSSYVEGVQSQGVGTCLKHYAGNNQEKDREYIDAIIDERTLREIYLKAFEIPVKKAKPWCVMTGLNQVNGEYCSENNMLLSQVLRQEWGFDGVAMSDWSGVNDRIKGIKNQLDLEMPYSYGVSEKRIKEALENGEITEDEIDICVKNLLLLMERAIDGRKVEKRYKDADHNAFAKKMAERCAVLLKNKDSILPIKRNARIAVFGNFAVNPRFKMEGSALVNPTRFDIPLDEIRRYSENVVFVEGYDKNDHTSAESLLEASSAAVDSEISIVFAGISGGMEAEGRDRDDMRMPEGHVKLIESVSKANPNTIVVLLNGSPVEMDWESKVNGILEMFLGGQCMGSAVASILFGSSNPGGKLPMSFPYRLEQNPSYLNYPGYNGIVEYKEGVFVGYRYYTSKEIKTHYPFGYGLSYTVFSSSIEKVEKKGVNEYEVFVRVKNEGEMEGSEVLELFVAPAPCPIPRPIRELKAFERVDLKPLEEKTISFSLTEEAFSYFDEELDMWYAPRGTYQIQLCKNAECVIDEISVEITPEKEKHENITGWSSIGTLISTTPGMEAFLEMKKILRNSGKPAPLTLPLLKDELDDRIKSTPLRMLTVLSDNILTNDMMNALVSEVNKRNLEK